MQTLTLHKHQQKNQNIYAHCREAIDAQTGKHKLQCNYCPNSYSYKGGNTSSMIQHLRASHRDNPDVVRDFPETPGKTPSKVQEKRSLAQASIVEGIDQMKPMHPSNRVAMKITDCLIVQAAIRYLWDPIIDESPPCLGHTVQLVVNDSVDSQCAVIDVLAIGRNIVSYVNKSKPAKQMLLQLQRDQGVTSPLTLLQNVEPRLLISIHT